MIRRVRQSGMGKSLGRRELYGPATQQRPWAYVPSLLRSTVTSSPIDEPMSISLDKFWGQKRRIPCHHIGMFFRR